METEMMQRFKMKRVAAVLLLVGALGALSAQSEREHPYLFFKAEQIPEFRERIRELPWVEQAYRKMVETVDRCEGIELPPPNSDIREVWRPMVHRYPRIATYAAFLYLVEGNEKQVWVHRKGATRAFPPHHPLTPDKRSRRR